MRHSIYTQTRELMKMSLTQSRLVSASEMSRLANQPVGKLLRGIHSGVILPDSTVLDGRLHLFREDRVQSIKETLSAL